MKKRLLIVEDDNLIAQLEKDYLSANGYDVAVYNDGVSGLDAALNNDYNLIILDCLKELRLHLHCLLFFH